MPSKTLHLAVNQKMRKFGLSNLWIGGGVRGNKFTPEESGAGNKVKLGKYLP